MKLMLTDTCMTSLNCSTRWQHALNIVNKAFECTVEKDKSENSQPAIAILMAGGHQTSKL